MGTKDGGIVAVLCGIGHISSIKNCLPLANAEKG